MGKIISFNFNLPDYGKNTSTGKTTTCVNLGACLAEQGKKILIVDMGIKRFQFNDASNVLATTKEALTIADVLRGQVEPSAAIKPTQVKNLFILPNSKDMSADTEFELLNVKKDREFVLRNALDKIRDQYDYIFIDCSSIPSLLLTNAFVAADCIIIPVTYENFVFDGVVNCVLRSVDTISKRLNLQIKLEGLVLNNYSPYTGVHKVKAELTRHFGDKVYHTSIPRSIHIADASTAQKPVCLYAPKSAVTKAYRRLATEFLERNS